MAPCMCRGGGWDRGGNCAGDVQAVGRHAAQGQETQQLRRCLYIVKLIFLYFFRCITMHFMVLLQRKARREGTAIRREGTAIRSEG